MAVDFGGTRMASIARDYRVLIVEDDPELLHVTQEHLSRAGYEVHTAANGWDALKCLKEGAADLVISELNLADTDGSSLREKFLLNPGMRDIPFLYLAEAGLSERQIQGLRSGVDDYIVKPFDPVAFVARVQTVIERRRIYEEMVRVDPLTRLLNRWTLEKQIGDELERVRRYNRFGSIALLDLDDFSHVNADQGQSMGDLILTCLAGIMMTHIRHIDIAGRYRGAQFMLYFPETPELGAHVVVDRIHSQFRKDADAVTGLDITFSAGIVETPRDSTDLSLLFKRAEAATYLAKEKGKARIVLWAKELGESDANHQTRP